MLSIRTITTALILFVFSLKGLSQATISGRIINENEKEISYVTVVLYEGADSSMVKGLITDISGAFSFSNVTAGDYFLTSSSVGYKNQTLPSFYFSSKKNLVLPELMMIESVEELEEVVVETKRDLIEVQPDKTIFNVEGSINATGNTALELLRKSPGVVVDNNENLAIQGKTGVLVYIDGKRSPLSPDDLAIYLKNLQSDQVDAIEIITNPSAKYDAEGNAGIINIRLIKDKNLGTNGSVNLGFRYGLNPKYNGSVNLNNRTRFINTFGSYSLFTGDNENEFFLTRDQSGTFFDQKNSGLNENTNHSFRIGADVFLTPKITLGVLVNGNRNNNDSYSTSVTEIAEKSDFEIDSLLIASNDQINTRENTNYNINFVWELGKGKLLSVDFDHGNFENRSSSLQPNTYYLPDEITVLNERTFSNVTPTDIDIYTAKADLELPFLDGALETGLKSTNIRTDNTFENYDILDGERIKNIDRSNNFVYLERVNAAYVSWKKSVNDRISLSAGIRGEHTHSDGKLTSEQETEDEKVVRYYFNLFPSAGISYSLDQSNSIRVSYSRRIDRPNYQDLNPFEYQLDELSFSKGNPFLRPQYSNTFGMAHTFKGTLSTSLNYTVITDVNTRITEAVDENSARLVYVNLARQSNLGITVSYPFSVTKWWNVYGTVTGFRLRNEANIEGDEINLKTLAMNGYAQNTFTLPKGFQVELSGWYNSPAIWAGNWTTDAQWDLSAGVSKQLFNKRGNLKVSVSDIFLTNPWGGESNFGALRMTGGGRWESRQVRINFSYNLGNNKVKAARKRQTGMEEETQRVN